MNKYLVKKENTYSAKKENKYLTKKITPSSVKQTPVPLPTLQPTTLNATQGQINPLQGKMSVADQINNQYILPFDFNYNPEVSKEDVGNSFLSSMVGLNTENNSILGLGAKKLTEATAKYPLAQQAQLNPMDNPIIAKLIEESKNNTNTLPMFTPQTQGGKLASSAGAMAGDLPLMFVNPGASMIKGFALKPIAKAALGEGITGGLIGAGQGALTGGTVEDIARQAGLGAVLGGAGGALFGKLGSSLNKATNPIPSQKELNDIADSFIPDKYKSAAAEVEFPESEIVSLEGLSKNQIDAKKVNRGLNEQFQASNVLPETKDRIVFGNRKEGLNTKSAWNKFYTSVVDTQRPIMKTNEATGVLASNSRNVSGVIEHNIRQALVNRNGIKVGESLESVANTIPKGKEVDFWDYMLHQHNIDRAAEGNNIFPDFSPEMSQTAISNILKTNPEFKQIGDDITQWIDKFMQTWGVDAGIVNKDAYQELRNIYKNYIPTQRYFSELEKSIPEGVSKKFFDASSPIKKATGSDRDIINPLENIMQLVSRTIKTAKYNEVGQSLVKAVKENPAMKELAEIIPTKEGMFSNVDNVVSVLENGKPVYLKIKNKELLDAMNGLPKVINNAKGMRAVTNVFKGLITTKNPFFAIRNLSRDIPTAYAYGSENNPIKFGIDLIKAGKDVSINSPNFQRYKSVGGGMSNFFKSDTAWKAAEEVTNPSKFKGLHPLRALENFNNLIEAAPRVAEFNRVLERTGDVDKALFASNDVTVNFARGGNVTKSAEPFVPYLNAGVQGLDKFFRGFKNPKTAIATLVKSGVGITAPTIALYVINKDNPNYQALDNRTKDTYFLIPNPLGTKDKKGNIETFIKLPKSRELGVLFGSLFERVMRVAEGQEDPFKGFGKTVATNFSPANPIENNFFSPIYSVKANKDFADRAIVPQGMLMDGRSDYLQYDEKTTSIAKKIGELAHEVTGREGWSPKIIDYIIKSYTGVVGQVVMPNFVQGGNAAKTIQNSFTSDPAFSNQSTSDFYDKLDKLTAAAKDKNILKNIPSKEVTKEEAIKNAMSNISEAVGRANDNIRVIQASNAINKDEQVRKIKLQILNIMQKANNAKTPLEMGKVVLLANSTFKKK